MDLEVKLTWSELEFDTSSNNLALRLSITLISLFSEVAEELWPELSASAPVHHSGPRTRNLVLIIRDRAGEDRGGSQVSAVINYAKPVERSMRSELNWA